jgi:hypothetical protein
MLENYYDVATAEEFGRLFGHLAIGKNPTERHNRYFVMKWDFSAVDPQGDSREIRRSLHNHINGCIEQFIARYEDRLSSVNIDNQDCLHSFQSVLAAVSRTRFRLYLLIDEYDNFANEVMRGSHAQTQKQRYEDLLYGEGSLKTVFKAVKSASAGRGLDRVFITGVSPVVLSDIASGYNIAENTYLLPRFADLCGFSETEIRDVLLQISEECNLSEEKTSEAMSMMRTFYNGYRFGQKADNCIYNPTLAIWFMKTLHRDCEYPQNMLDSNLAMDRGKITYISQLPGGGNIVMGALNKESAPSVRNLADRFGVEDMLTERKDNTFMASLLYYFGMLTFSDKKTDMGDSILKIPNLVIRKLYAERIREMFLPDITGDEIRHIAQNFYKTGNMQTLCDFIGQKYFKVFDNRDYRWTNELVVKTAFLTLLFDDSFYIMDSETSLERGYADLTMIVRPDMRQYPISDFLIEFKYIGLKDAGFTGEQVKQMGSDELRLLPSIQQKSAESETKLECYRNILLSEYGSRLRLRTYSVVSIGFERLIWEEPIFNAK